MVQIVIIGFGAVAKSFVYLMLKLRSSFCMYPVVIFEPNCINDSEVFNILKNTNNDVTHVREKITKQNYSILFKQYVERHAIVIDIAYRVSTLDIINACQQFDCLYVNTSLDEWEISNLPLMLLKQKINGNIKYGNHKMTSVLNHGMNPGIVSHFIKYLLATLARKSNDVRLIELADNNKYNVLAEKLGITLIQIAERDTQISNNITTESNFINTWSVVGLIDEITLNCEISWGTHEKKLPKDCDMSKLNDTCQIYLPLKGYQLRTLSFETKGGKFTGYCIPHAECYSVANYLRIENTYRPTVYYSYMVPDNAKIICHYIDYCLDEKRLPQCHHVLHSDEIISGYDSVGCLVYLKNGKKFWIGSIMDNNIAKKLCREINVTCMQVGISIVACIEWMLLHPYCGVIEPEDVDTNFILSYCKDWLGELYCADVTSKCDIKSDQFSDLVVFPQNTMIFQ